MAFLDFVSGAAFFLLLLASFTSFASAARVPQHNVRRRQENEWHLIDSKNDGFANFHPISTSTAWSSTSSFSEKKPKDDQSLAGNQGDTVRPKTQADLEKGHQRSQEQFSKEDTNLDHLRRITVRHLEAPTCHDGVEGHQYVVQCTEMAEEACHNELEEAGAVIVNELPNSDFFVVCVDTPEEKELLLELANVVTIEQDYERTLSYLPEMTRPATGRNLAQQVPYGVSLIDADTFWTSKNNKGAGAKVCIIDTGIMDNHEDFAGSSISGSNSNTVETPYNQDQNGHGTHVAGTVAAKDNGKGAVGVAPDAELFIVRVFSGRNAAFTASSLSAAMEECRKAGSDVVNMSLGGASSSVVERNKINQLVNQGIHVVAASGNSGNGGNPVEYPASYPTVISVGAVDENQEVAIFSTHNAEVDVAAPGVDIYSLTSQCYNCYAYYSGTSMASPHVAGAVALLVSKYPNKSREQIRQALEQSAKDVGVCGTDRMYGHGLINVMDAAAYLESNNVASAAAPEQTGCVNAKITIKTDKWGSESSYVIKGPSGEVVYKNGPYPNNREVSYVDEIQLPALPAGDCYEFVMIDSYGDGMCCENGNGFFQVEYNGVEEVKNESFLNGASSSEAFGCGGGSGGGGGSNPTAPPVPAPTSLVPAPTPPPIPSPTPPPVPAPTPPPVSQPTTPPVPAPTLPPAVCGDGIVNGNEECDEGTNNSNTGSCTSQCKNAKCGDGFVQAGEECDDGNSQQGDGCSIDCKIETISTSCPTGQSQVELFLKADSYSYSENELYFFERKDNPDEEIDDFIWIGTERGIISNRQYELSECVNSNKCYRFFFFDNYGDGLFSEGLRLKFNGAEKLVIERDEVGDVWEGGPAVYWMRELGNCPNQTQ